MSLIIYISVIGYFLFLEIAIWIDNLHNIAQKSKHT
jgi:hypothetical protein